jgi:hypothetical protein
MLATAPQFVFTLRGVLTGFGLLGNAEFANGDCLLFLSLRAVHEERGAAA